jgi:hypothetical protein
MYRELNVILNTVLGLIRGTGGTGAADHAAGAEMYDIGRGNLLDANYQDYIVKNTILPYDPAHPKPDRPVSGQTTFYAPNINIDNLGDSSTASAESIEVYVGGTRQYAYSDTTADSQYRWFVTDFSPLAVEFVVDSSVEPELLPPADGAEVTILQRRGVTWYAPGNGTPSNGVALQETDTAAARFFRGQ